jgi:hypothetical protein
MRAECKPEQRARVIFYHYESAQVGLSIERDGFAVAHRGERFVLNRRPSLEQETDAQAVRERCCEVRWIFIEINVLQQKMSRRIFSRPFMRLSS